jgi:hypothetical protein
MSKTSEVMRGLPEKPAPGRLYAGKMPALQGRARTPARAGEMPTLPRQGIPMHEVRITVHPGSAATLTFPESKKHYQNNYALPRQECILVD